MIYALHGFLGLASDWDFLKEKMSLNAENLWPLISTSMSAWAQKKAAELAAQLNQKNKTRPNSEPRILLGYSMGGRLAMHLLLANPEIWDAAIFVSANPGTSNIEEREIRRKLDHKWAQKFLKNDWAEVCREWNGLSLFKVQNPAEDALHLRRDEKDFTRTQLAAALTHWSIAEQEDLTPRLGQISLPILWMAGSEDAKYRALLAGLAQNSSQRFAVIANAAHRVPWDHPSEFIAVLGEFLHPILRVDLAQAKDQ